MWARSPLSLAIALCAPLLLLAQDDECGLLDLFQQIDTIQAVCCNAATCNTPLGMPGAIDPCTRDCKNVYLPFWTQCGDFVNANAMDVDGGLAEFQLTCMQPPPPPPGETCTALTGEQAAELSTKN